MANDYEARLRARADRMRGRAEALRVRSTALYGAARDAVAGIEPGQPILVGHHSERRHRRDLDRHDRRMRAAIEAEKHAAELERRAEAVGRGGISSDDPEAVTKLAEKAGQIDANIEKMKACNAAWRKAGRPLPANEEGWQRVADALGIDVVLLHTARLRLARCPYEEQPYPAWMITNARARQRQAEKRAGALAKVDRGAPARSWEAAGATITDDPEGNRVRITFPGKPGREMRERLKANGFRWAPTIGAWQRQRTANALVAAEMVLGVASVTLGERSTASQGGA